MLFKRRTVATITSQLTGLVEQLNDHETVSRQKASEHQEQAEEHHAQASIHTSEADQAARVAEKITGLLN